MGDPDVLEYFNEKISSEEVMAVGPKIFSKSDAWTTGTKEYTPELMTSSALSRASSHFSLVKYTSANIVFADHLVGLPANCWVEGRCVSAYCKSLIIKLYT